MNNLFTIEEVERKQVEREYLQELLNNKKLFEGRLYKLREDLIDNLVSNYGRKLTNDEYI